MHYRKTMVRFSAKIKIFLIIFPCLLAVCSSVETSAGTEKPIVTEYVPDRSHVYKMSDTSPNTEQEDEKTMRDLGKLLHELEKDFETHKMKEDLKNQSISIVNYMTNFTNMFGKNENKVTSQENRTDGTEISKNEVVTTVIPNATESNGIISVTMGNIEDLILGFRNKRDETIMKIPRNSVSIRKKSTSNEEDQPENSTEPFVVHDESTHMINWNNSSKLNEKLKENEKADNDSSSDGSGFISPIIDRVLYSSETKNESTKYRVEWLPDIFSGLFFNFKISSKAQNSICNRESLFYHSQLKNLSLWAAKMYESSDLIPRGFIVGNGYQLGNFDECIGVRDPSGGIFGKYCLIETHLNFTRMLLPLPKESDSAWNVFRPLNEASVQFRRDTLYLSMCIPSGCKSEDLEYSLQSALAEQASSLNGTISFQVHSNMCFAENQQEPVSQGYIITCLFFATISVLVIGMSAYHLVSRALGTEKSSLTIQANFMMSFSAIINLKQLFSRSEHELGFLNGIKFLSMCLIILGHRFVYYFQSAILDGDNILHKFLEFDYIIIHLTVVDTFFTIGGFLTYYTLYDKIKQKGALFFPLAILYRLMRLIPVYALTIAFVAYVMPFIGNGPIYQLKIAKEVERCQQNWWTSLLFISNYVNTSNSCLLQSWYLSCDLQLFLVGLFILYIMTKNERVGIKLLYSLLVVSIITSFLISWNYGDHGVLKLTRRILEDPVSSDYFVNIYSKTHNRATCYLLGMMTSHLCLKMKQQKFKFTVKQSVLLSIITYIFMDVAQFYQWLFYIPDRPFYPLESAIYTPLHKVLWSSGICIIIVVFITTGYGVISPILNHSMYVPLSRLTYCALLIHNNVQLITNATARVPEYLTYKKLLWMVGADIMVTYTLAVVIYLVVEAPVGNLVNIVLKKKKY